ncbi:MAG: hypothetical protein JXB08_01630 [Bacilli bacterium]|nr:hypothetical protein [Bacilli bacterium]MBN2877713.1 hypothetical protein [Bacilli bacterium]
MKWTIQELIKKAKSDNTIETTLQLSRFLTEELEDLVGIGDTLVTGDYTYDDIEEVFDFQLHIETTLTMLCALTLKEVPVKLNFTSHIGFSLVYIDDDTHVIDGITIDLDQYIFSEILVEKPMKVYSPQAMEEYREDIYEMDEEERMATSPFAKYIKEEE